MERAVFVSLTECLMQLHPNSHLKLKIVRMKCVCYRREGTLDLFNGCIFIDAGHLAIFLVLYHLHKYSTLSVESLEMTGTF